MKKRGFTLIEVLISIFILTILFSGGMSMVIVGLNISSDIKITGYMYEIQNLLSYGKSICKDKKKSGKIEVSCEKNEITFIDKWDEIEKNIVLPEELKLIKSLTIFIKSDGTIEKGNTIMIVDKWLKRHDVAIRVGVDLIEIKGD